MASTTATLLLDNGLQVPGRVTSFTVDKTVIGPADNPISTRSEITVTFTAGVPVDMESALVDILDPKGHDE